MICGLCRVEVQASRVRGWIHSEPTPEGQKDHEVLPVNESDFYASSAEAVSANHLKVVRERVGEIRRILTDQPWLQVTDVARDAVALLDHLESLEAELNDRNG